MRRLLFLELFIVFGSLCSAQTKLTFILNENTLSADSIKISKFSGKDILTIPYKNGSSASFQEKFADLFTIELLIKGKEILKYQRWIDTGKIKIILGNTKSKSISIDTIIGSDLTYKSQRFLLDLGYYQDRTDTLNTNSLLIRTYKENLGNPFSFYVGEIFYDYNKMNYLTFSKLNSFERIQNRVIKNNIFYAMMLAKRFRYSEHLLINFFTKGSFINIQSNSTFNPLDKNKFNIILVLDSMTTQSLNAFKDFENATLKFNSKNFNTSIAINLKHYNSWQELISRSKIKQFFTIDGNSFSKETLFYLDTKYYVLNGNNRIDGYYDTLNEVLKHFDKK